MEMLGTQKNIQQLAANHERPARFLALSWGIIGCALLLSVLFGRPATAQVIYSLNQDTRILFERGEFNESRGFIHIFDAQLEYQGDVVLIAEELKAELRSSLDAEDQVIETIYAQNLIIIDPEEHVQMTIDSLSGSDIALHTASIPSSANDSEIVRFITAERPTAIELNGIKAVSEADGIQMRIDRISLEGTQNITNDATAAQHTNHLRIEKAALSAYGNNLAAYEFTAALRELGLEEVILYLDGLSNLSYANGTFESELALTLDAPELSDIAFSISGQASKTILELGEQLNQSQLDNHDDAELLGLLMANSGDIALVSAQLVLTDKGILNFVETEQAAFAIDSALSEFSTPLSQVASQPVRSFLEQGGSLAITLSPPRPANLVQLASVFFAPDAAIFMLGLEVNYIP